MSESVEKFCPNCGAPVDLSGDNCKHCGSFLPGIALYRKEYVLKEKDIELNGKYRSDERKAKLEHEQKMQAMKDKREQEKANNRFFYIGVGVLAILAVLLHIAGFLARR